MDTFTPEELNKRWLELQREESPKHIRTQEQIDAEETHSERLLGCGFIILIVAIIMLIISFFVFMKPKPAHAQETPCPAKIADAIYLAEGGAKTRHPYGILAHYKHTTPRQACINTINHALRDWDGRGDFILFLSKRYCPIGASNDPRGLNKFYVRNVRYFLNRGA